MCTLTILQSALLEDVEVAPFELNVYWRQRWLWLSDMTWFVFLLSILGNISMRCYSNGIMI